MQSSIRSETPRLVTISANPSSTSIPLNGGVQIDREVVVTTHRYPSKRASYPSIPGHDRSQSIETDSRGTVNRTQSNSRVSERSAKRRSRPFDTENSVYLDTNRESMRALAEFLMTREPPPSNWMSVPSDDEMSLRTIKRYKVFGREHKKRKMVPKGPRFMKLPDVAVAATTRQGSRHIAISIPIEHDYPQLLRPSTDPHPRPATTSRLYSSDRGAVTVLKPVVELRESASSILPNQAGIMAQAEVQRPRTSSLVTPPIDILGPEATRTLENYYLQLQKQQQKANYDLKQKEIAKGQRTHTGTSLDASKPDPRFSSATMNSSVTYSTVHGHSRGVSSVSTAPSVNQMAAARLDNLPQRTSSKSMVPLSIGEGLQSEPVALSFHERSRSEATVDPRKSMNGSFNSSTSSSTSPPIILGTGTADLARGYKSPGPQYLSRSNTPLASTAPNKKLPDLPAGAQIRRPSTAPIRETPVVTDVTSTAKRTSSVKNNTSELEQATQQSRLERVKARKMRDLAASRTKKADGPSQEQVKAQPSGQNDGSKNEVLPPQTQVHVQPSHSHKRLTSNDLAAKKALNSITPIMIVANLPPFTGIVLASDLPSPPIPKAPVLKKSTSAASANTMVRVVHTPPRSIHEEFGVSDSDTIPTRPHSMSRSSWNYREKARNSISPNRTASVGSNLDARRQERRSKRNMTLHEREMDKRIERLERDNALLVSTLRVIAGSFGVLNKLLPESSDVVRRGPSQPDRHREPEIEGQDKAIEVLMKELQKNARRVGRDFPPSGGRMRLEESEDEREVVRAY